MKSDADAFFGGGGGAVGAEEDAAVCGLSPLPVAAAKTRPTMISAKYRLKEERRKVLKLSVSKLRKIEDPESSLRRSVLINNTMRRLQREAREEKLQRQFPSAARASPAPAPAPAVLAAAASVPASQAAVDSKENHAPAPSAPQRKRLYDDVDDCDVQDVLSQFYMPPTPRMLTSIDDSDEERDHTPEPDPAPPCKRLRLEVEEEQDLLAAAELSGPQDVDMTLALHAAGLATRLPTPAAPSSVADAPSPPPVSTPADSHYSCGHASIFGEIQSVVYHSLIASLES